MKQANPEPTPLALTVPDKPAELAVAKPAPNVADMLQAVIQGGVTQENVGALEKLCGLYERMEARSAEQKYAIALATLQKECSTVIATVDVDGKFRYAPFLDIWNAVRPAVERNGFTLQWDQEHLGDRVKKKLTLLHIAGHKTTREWTIRLGSSAPGTPAGSQAPVLDEIADSRAKRRLLMDALNIVVDAITPAEDVGDGTLASAEETDTLHKRLTVLGGDAASEKRFLALAGVQAWNQIAKVNLAILDRLLAEKERSARNKQATPAPRAEAKPTQAVQPVLPMSDSAPVKPQPAAAQNLPITEARKVLLKQIWDLTADYRLPNETSWTTTREYLLRHGLAPEPGILARLTDVELGRVIEAIKYHQSQNANRPTNG